MWASSYVFINGLSHYDYGVVVPYARKDGLFLHRPHYKCAMCSEAYDVLRDLDSNIASVIILMWPYPKG